MGLAEESPQWKRPSGCSVALLLARLPVNQLYTPTSDSFFLLAFGL